MSWIIKFHDEFEKEYEDLPARVRKKLTSVLTHLSIRRPSLGWPLVDTLKGTRYPRTKELRVILSDEERRIAFVFDPERNAVQLVAGTKTGINQWCSILDLLRLLRKGTATTWSSYHD